MDIKNITINEPTGSKKIKTPQDKLEAQKRYYHKNKPLQNNKKIKTPRCKLEAQKRYYLKNKQKYAVPMKKNKNYIKRQKNILLNELNNRIINNIDVINVNIFTDKVFIDKIMKMIKSY